MKQQLTDRVRWRIAVFAAFLTAFGASASEASATTAEVYYDSRAAETFVFVHGGAANNDIAVSETTDPTLPSSDRVFVIEDSQPIESGNECTNEAPTKVRCVSDSFPNLQVSGERGDDGIALHASVLSGDTELGGGKGDDVLKGGRYADDLTGGTGRDELFGRGGSDFLKSFDHRGDKEIACGKGHGDEAKIDRAKDPQPTGCERVHRK